jgi:hypothetical protein
LQIDPTLEVPSRIGSTASVANVEIDEHNEESDVEQTRMPVFKPIDMASEDFKDERDGAHSNK